jgi:hypothetical protein
VIDYRDEPFVRSIVRDASKNGDHFTSFVLGIVRSVPFEMRRVDETEPHSPDVTAERSNR